MQQLFRPNLLGTSAEENIRILFDYLYQLTEQLEFILDNIDTDNLSQPLINKLNKLGAGLEATQTTNAQTQQQVGRIETITVSDVLNSSAFIAALEGVKDDVKTTGGTGYVRFSDGTLVCYGGTSTGTVTFPKTFSEVPTVIATIEVVKTATGLTSDTQSFEYIAIGKEENNG